MTDANARCQDDTLFATQIQVVDLGPLQCIARSSPLKSAETKKWRACEEGGGLSNARLFVAAVRVRCGRNRLVGRNIPTGRVPEPFAPTIIQTMHFCDYSNSDNPICTDQNSD